MLSGAEGFAGARSRRGLTRPVAADAADKALLGAESARAPLAAAESLRNVRRSVDMRLCGGRGQDLENGTDATATTGHPWPLREIGVRLGRDQRGQSRLNSSSVIKGSEPLIP